MISGSLAASLDAEAVHADKDHTGTADNAPAETTAFKVVHGKTTHSLSMAPSALVADLRARLAAMSGIDPPLLKLLFRGVLKDSQTLAAAGIRDGCKVVMMASTAQDILRVTTAAPASAASALLAAVNTPKEPLSAMPEHKKVIDKGRPADAEVGVRNADQPLPERGLVGLLNAWGAKTRLALRLELDQVWISTNDYSKKIDIPSIRGVVAEPIAGMEEYWLLGLQLGPTAKSLYWLYFVPAQYVRHIRRSLQ
ncbi:hypothetical protein BC831DRAFT_460093 [Entophlyctis helioformis]|nr:hypothetical protein BC831DRAFT_460093 [Entophlyctis helioformis]